MSTEPGMLTDSRDAAQMRLSPPAAPTLAHAIEHANCDHENGICETFHDVWGD